MPDFRVADTAPEHPKLRAAGLAAAGLWSMAGAWAMRELTDGWVPDYWVASWPSGRRAATTLVKVGLWYREQRRGIDGYVYHDWEGYQRLAAEFEEAAEQKRRVSAQGNHRRWHVGGGRLNPDCPLCRDSPTDPRGSPNGSPEVIQRGNPDRESTDDPGTVPPHPHPHPHPAGHPGNELSSWHSGHHQAAAEPSLRSGSLPSETADHSESVESSQVKSVGESRPRAGGELAS